MSGHSKWATIKHRKNLTDNKRARLFSKITKEILVATKLGGDNVDSNPRLKTAIVSARGARMPNKNIENAIKKGCGIKQPGVNYQEITYEGYGPGGVAFLIECLTDNKNRTVADLRTVFSKNQGRLGEMGSVNWQFEKKGLFYIEKQIISEDKLMEITLSLEVEDLESDDNGYVVYTCPEDFIKVYDEFKKQSINLINAEIAMMPKNTIIIDSLLEEKIQRLTTLLDDLEDVKSVASNEVIKK
jgi:YebC/PmpR family DNA-binding regulatory protein